MQDQDNQDQHHPKDSEPAADDAAPERQAVDTDVTDKRGEASGDAIDLSLIKRILEAALLSAGEPLATSDLRRLFENQIDADTIRKLLDELRQEWHDKSVELTAVSTGWRFRVRPDYQKYIDRLNPEKPPRYSRAVLETLAIIAYRQPVTRADIEQIRGVAVSPHSLKALEDRGWVEAIGHRETPGRPALFATTKAFLNDVNLRSIEELPPLEELQSALDASFAPAQPELVPDETAEEPAASESEHSAAPEAAATHKGDGA